MRAYLMIIDRDPEGIRELLRREPVAAKVKARKVARGELRLKITFRHSCNEVEWKSKVLLQLPNKILDQCLCNLSAHAWV
jgi:hypothetical protein